MTEEVSQQKRRKDLKDLEDRRANAAANFLLRSQRNGIFFQNGMLATLIPVQHKLGYKFAPLRQN